MKSIILFLIFSAFSCLCFSQTKTLEIQDYAKKDSAYFQQWAGNDLQCNSLPNLLKSKDSLHFRFSNGIQSVDIWTNDYKIFYGTLLNETQSHIEHYRKGVDINKQTKKYQKLNSIDTAKARQVYELFKRLNIFSIPDQDQIKGWRMGNDGISFNLEFSSKYLYTLKSYWTPHAYKYKIKEAALIDSLSNQLERVLEMRRQFNTFLYSLAPGCYAYGGIVTCFKRAPLIQFKTHMAPYPKFLYSKRHQKRKMPGFYVSNFIPYGAYTTHIVLYKDSSFKYRFNGYDIDYKTNGFFKKFKDTLYLHYNPDTISIYQSMDTAEYIMVFDSNGNWVKTKPAPIMKFEIADRPQKLLYRYKRLWIVVDNNAVIIKDVTKEHKVKKYYLKRVKTDDEWKDFYPFDNKSN